MHLPRSLRDWGAFILFIFGGHLYLWYQVYMVLPFYHQDETITLIVYIHYIFAALAYINILGNLFLMRKINIKVQLCQNNDEIYGSIPGWKICMKCGGDSPPRSHHCKVCDICVVRRDHHCWFAASCVGLQNHRQYMIILIWVLVTAIYGNIFDFQYIGYEMGGHSIITWLCIFTPHVAVVLGAFTLKQFFIAFMTFCAYFFMVLVCVLLREQIIQIKTGQTKYERKYNIRTYDRGTWNNIKEVLGRNWYLIWFIPCIPSQLPLDGNYTEQTDKTK